MKSSNGKKLVFADQFREGIDYIKESAGFIWIGVLVFVIGTWIGFYLPGRFVELDEILRNTLRDIFLQAEGLNGFELTIFILQNNLQSAFVAVLTGIFLGIFPVLTSIVNGILIGYVSNVVVSEVGFLNLWRLIPHGIFELPAVFISIGLGIKLGFSIFSKNSGKEFSKNFYQSMNAFLVVVFPLLILAAIIEGLLIAFF